MVRITLHTLSKYYFWLVNRWRLGRGRAVDRDLHRHLNMSAETCAHTHRASYPISSVLYQWFVQEHHQCVLTFALGCRSPRGADAVPVIAQPVCIGEKHTHIHTHTHGNTMNITLTAIRSNGQNDTLLVYISLASWMSDSYRQNHDSLQAVLCTTPCSQPFSLSLFSFALEVWSFLTSWTPVVTGEILTLIIVWEMLILANIMTKD